MRHPSRHAAPPAITEHPPAARPPPRGPLDCRRLRPKGDMGGASTAQLHELYRYMYLTRRLEELLVTLHRQGHIVGGVYRSLGQEGTAVGCAYAMQAGDIVQPLIRDLGAALVHGVEPLAMLRQYMAKATGPTAGRDLNNHFSSPRHGILGPVSMLGATVPVLAGCLLAARLQGRARCGLGFIGDGGSSTGAFYEGINLAVVQRLPLVMVLEANQYAYSTPTSAQLPQGDLVCRARGFGTWVLDIDGNDVVACWQAAAHARRRGLAGEGPTLIVAHTYRRRGHAEHDNQSYLDDPGEPAAWEQHNDPLQRFVDHLQDGEAAHVAPLEQLRRDVDTSLGEWRDQALADPAPEALQQPLGVFAKGPCPHPSPTTWMGAGARWRGAGHG